VTTRVEVADVQQTQIQGWTGGIDVVLLVKGDYQISVDLSKACYVSVDETYRMAVLQLPTPLTGAPSLDHRRTRLFAVRPYGLWALVPGDRAASAALNRSYLLAQDSLVAAMLSDSARERSRQQAQAVLQSFFKGIGWELSVRWSGGPVEAEKQLTG